jgi:hypothetical protein
MTLNAFQDKTCARSALVFLHSYVAHRKCSIDGRARLASAVSWLENVFAPASAKRLDRRSDRRALIMDGYSSHFTGCFLEFAEVEV